MEEERGPGSCSILELQQGASNTVSVHHALTQAWQMDKIAVVVAAVVVPCLKR